MSSDTQSKDLNNLFSKESSPVKKLDKNSVIESESYSSSCSSLSKSKLSMTINKPTRTVSNFYHHYFLEQYNHTKATIKK